MKRVQEIHTHLVQRINIHFCAKMGLPLPATIAALHLVFPQDCLSDRRIRFWYSAFQNGRTTLVDLQHAPRPKTSRSPGTIQAVKDIIEADPRVTMKAIQMVVNIPLGSLHSVIHKDLKLTLQCARFVPHDLTPRHLRLRYDACRALLNSVRRPGEILKRIITSDEAWVYQYDPETRRQSSQWMPPGSARPVKARRPRAQGKVLLVMFFDHKGMVYFEMLRNQTMTSAVFVQVLGRLHQALRIRRPHPRHPWILHMDNAIPQGGPSCTFSSMACAPSPIHPTPLTSPPMTIGF